VHLHAQADLGVGVAVMQPEHVVMPPMGCDLQLHDRIELVEGRDEGGAEAPADAHHAVAPVEAAAVVGVDQGIQADQQVDADDGHE